MPEKIIISPVIEADLPSIKSLLIELTEAMADTDGLDISQFLENTRKFKSCGFSEDAVLLEIDLD
jgi:hypothetical protein